MSNQPKNAKASHGLSFLPASNDDYGSVGEGGGCTIRQDIFALAVAETGNQAAAYRLAYNVTDNTSLNTIWATASRLANTPHVRRRIDEYRQKFALEAKFNVEQVFQWQLDIATADPTEVAYIAKRSCRYCHGENHKYQWVDLEEYLLAVAESIDNDKRTPSEAGGYGFSHGREPAPDCPRCLGEGFPEVVINDLRKITGKSRKLIAGIDYKQGLPVVKFHDQAKAWDFLLRMLGVHKEILIQQLKKNDAGPMPENIKTEKDALQYYLSRIG